MGVKEYIVKRLMLIIPTVIGVIILNFVILHLAPGDPVYMLAGEAPSLEYIERVRHEFGLDKPLHEQLVVYIIKVFQGNLGYSYTYRQPVLNLILERAPATLLLVGTGLSIAIVIGIVAGVVSASKPFSLTDHTITTFTLLGYSMPIFWVGQMLIMVFALNLAFFPTGGIQSLRGELIGIEAIIDQLKHLILPAITIAIYDLASISRITRSSMLEVLREDFITTARSKGLKRNRILYKHALRNAILPVVSLAGIHISLMISGAILTETVFAWPGMGRLMIEALLFRDYPVLLGLFTIIAISVIIVCLIIDLLYAVIDPRIAYE